MENTNTVQRSRCWFFTWNNFPADYAEKINFSDRYIYQVERGESGNLHLQGSMYFTNDKTFGQMVERFPGIHIEKSRWLASRIWYGLKEDTRIDGPFIKGVTDKLLIDAQAEAKARKVKKDSSEVNKRLKELEFNKWLTERLKKYKWEPYFD